MDISTFYLYICGIVFMNHNKFKMNRLKFPEFLANTLTGKFWELKSVQLKVYDVEKYYWVHGWHLAILCFKPSLWEKS